MVELLLVLILIALVVLIVIVVRGRSRRAPNTTPVPQDPFGAAADVAGDPRALKAGDMVEYLGTRYFVRGSLRLREDGFTWDEHLLEADTAESGTADATKVWISVEEDPDLEVVWWTERDLGGLTPDQPTIAFDGVEYRLDERGGADYRSEGSTGLGEGGRVEYADYEASGGRYLSFERFGGGSWEAGTGERVPRGALTIYPGS
ncbi:MAG: DUF4178 domain-containing protein [Actinomadura sp.]